MKKPEEYTEAELKELEDKNKAYYEEKLPYLRIWAEHDELLTKISEARFRKIQADSRFTQFMIEQQAMQEGKGKKDKPN